MKPLMTSLSSRFRQSKGKKGQTVVEYALILALVSVLTIVIMAGLGVEIKGIYAPIINALDEARRSIS